ncbi:MAG: zinc ribbon domain-containing protein [Slackia sp.]|nr:zinc ribbon domain-containing protein [Slackia sp.]
MGIWDNISGALNKGMEGAGRFADATSLKFKLGEAERKRRDLAADLGESLYASVENGTELPAECERIISDMRSVDAEISQLKADMERIAHESEVAKAASVSYCCPNCGATLSSGARFCHACGAPTAVAAAPCAVASDEERQVRPDGPACAPYAPTPGAGEQTYEVPQPKMPIDGSSR